MLRSLALIIAVSLIPVAALAAPDDAPLPIKPAPAPKAAIGKPAPGFSGMDYMGKAIKLSDYKGQIVVLEWTNPNCPFVRKHYGSGNMQKLQTYAHEKKVVWLSINSSAPDHEGHLTLDQARALFENTPPLADHYILDSSGKIGTLYGAKTTPHMFVIDKAGNLAYMGAIDDKPTVDKDDIETAHNYVRAAIDSLIAGTPVEVFSTQSYGCSVKYAD